MISGSWNSFGERKRFTARLGSFLNEEGDALSIGRHRDGLSLNPLDDKRYSLVHLLYIKEG